MKKHLFIRGKAPLRLGLAGGGTDVSPYADDFGGAILNATVNLFARTTIVPHDRNEINIVSMDLDQKVSYPSQLELPIDGRLDLIAGVYNRMVRDYAKKPLSFDLITEVDVPMGSGLGSSSTITVSLVGAFAEFLNLPLGDYDIARLAFDIERKDLALAGGRQDQYAATFGGVNFMEFYAEDKVVVNPLRIKAIYLEELEMNMLLYYTGKSRESAKIIKAQRSNFSHKTGRSLEAAHKLKEQANAMKEALLQGELDEIGRILDEGWHAKKQMASGISNPEIDELYDVAKKGGHVWWEN